MAEKLRRKVTNTFHEFGLDRALPIFPTPESLNLTDIELEWYKALFLEKVENEPSRSVSPSADPFRIQINISQIDNPLDGLG